MKRYEDLEKFLTFFEDLTGLVLKSGVLLPYDHLVINLRDAHDNSISANVHYVPNMNYNPSENNFTVYKNDVGRKDLSLQEIKGLFISAYEDVPLFFFEYRKDPLRTGKQTKKVWRSKARLIAENQESKINNILKSTK